MKDARSLVGCGAFPSSATPVHPFVTGWFSPGLGEVPGSKTEPIETHVLRHPREEAPRRVDQGAFHRPQFARVPDDSGRATSNRSPLTPPLRKGHCEALHPPFPVEVASLGFRPRLGRTNAFFTTRNALP